MIPIIFAIIVENVTNPLHQIASELLSQVDFTFGIGDIVGSIALLVSAFTFYISYAQSSQSEQIKTSRDIWAGIIGRYKELEAKELEAKELEAKTKAPASDSNREAVIKENIWPLLGEIDYFAYLIRKGEIKDKVVLGYYKDLLKEEIRYVFSHYGTDQARKDWRAEYHNLDRIIVEWKIKV